MFLHPLKNTNVKITSNYGYRKHPITGEYKLHNGVDLRAAENTKIFAPENGIVSGVYYIGGGGNQLTIAHNKQGVRTGYAHLNNVLVSKGQQVRRGQLVALSGNSGNSTAPHLHFTTKSLVTGDYIDPITLDYNQISTPWAKWLLMGGAAASLYLLYKKYGK